MSRSTHQLVYDFYALLSLTNAKGYAMMQFSWMLLRLYGKGKNTRIKSTLPDDTEIQV